MQVESINGIFGVCLKIDGGVQISYNCSDTYEVITLGVGEDGSSKIKNMRSSESTYASSNKLSFPILIGGKVPKTIYDYREHLLGIGSGEILKAIYDFATNKIKKMEENNGVENELLNSLTPFLVK